MFRIVEAFQDDHLWFDHLDEVVGLGALQLQYQGFWSSISQCKRNISNRLTYHIVAVLVANQVLQITVPFVVHRSQDTHDLLSLLQVAKLDAGLDNIAGEFVLGIVDEIRSDERDDPVSVLLPAVLDDMLCDIIAILIADEVLRAPVKLLQNCRSCRLNAMFQHALYDTTAIRVLRKLVHLPRKGVDDELNMLGWYAFDCFLHHMVPVLILDASHDLFVFLQLSNQRRLLVRQDMFKRLELIVSWYFPTR